MVVVILVVTVVSYFSVSDLPFKEKKKISCFKLKLRSRKKRLGEGHEVYLQYLTDRIKFHSPTSKVDFSYFTVNFDRRV